MISRRHLSFLRASWFKQGCLGAWKSSLPAPAHLTLKPQLSSPTSGSSGGGGVLGSPGLAAAALRLVAMGRFHLLWAEVEATAANYHPGLSSAPTPAPARGDAPARVEGMPSAHPPFHHQRRACPAPSAPEEHQSHTCPPQAQTRKPSG